MEKKILNIGDIYSKSDFLIKHLCDKSEFKDQNIKQVTVAEALLCFFFPEEMYQLNPEINQKEALDYLTSVVEKSNIDNNKKDQASNFKMLFEKLKENFTKSNQSLKMQGINNLQLDDYSKVVENYVRPNSRLLNDHLFDQISGIPFKLMEALYMLFNDIHTPEIDIIISFYIQQFIRMYDNGENNEPFESINSADKLSKLRKDVCAYASRVTSIGSPYQKQLSFANVL